MKETEKTDVDGHQQSSAAIEVFFADAITKVKAQAAQTIAEQRTSFETQAQQEIAKIKLANEAAIAEEKAKASEAAGRIIKVKTEAEEKIAQIKNEAEAKGKKHNEEIAKIRTEAEEKIKYLTEQIARFEAEVAERQGAHAEQIAKAKTEGEETIAKIKADCEEQIARLKTHAAEKRKTHEEQLAEVESKAKEETEKVKAEAEEMEKIRNEKIARVKAETEEKAKDLTEQIAKIKVEVAEKQKVVTTTESDNSAAGNVSETIQRITQSPAELSPATLAICAEDIMKKELVWGSTNDSVQQTLTKMKQQHAGYIMIGTDGILEGIVSKSDLSGALSPFLRPVFAKWRRPQDDATLQIKIKWIMSRPVHIISPQMPL
ncbi:MAG: CBS domain-containing protein, partial [Planctomycetota bacterium]